jgi:hypothetical protein
MRPFRLARIAAEAEGVRLRGMVTRIAVRAVFGAIALIFVMGVLVFAHIAAWYEIRVDLNQPYLATAGILGGVDLLLAVILGFLATRSSPSKVETDALEVRRKAVEGLTNALTLTQLAVPVLRLGTNLRRRRRA